MQKETNDMTMAQKAPEAVPVRRVEDYSLLLQKWEAPFSVTGHYLQVGNPDAGKGWILDISATESNVTALLDHLVPILLYERASFKIPGNEDVAKALLQGLLGFTEIGKIICIYPGSQERAMEIAALLIRETQGLKGPMIPTDYCLEGVVFARFGGYQVAQMTDNEGVVSCFFLDHDGNFLPEEYTIPFTLPKGIAWPFSSLSAFSQSKKQILLGGRYLVTHILKSDSKGRVMRAFYFRKWWDIRVCLLKEGVKNMASDMSGRDIQDKLSWQHQLSKELEGVISLPKAFEFFHDQGNAYFSTEFIAEGASLGDCIDALHQSIHWEALDTENKQILSDHLLWILDFVDSLHRNGYYHRDITSRNFIVTGQPGKFKRYGIDLELAYNFLTDQPNPPFVLGSPGYASPEQIRVDTPTAEQDIYGLGGLMLRLYTGLSPKIFSVIDPDILYQQLSFLTGSRTLAALIGNCLSIDPDQRPKLAEIKKYVASHTSQIGTPKKIAAISTNSPKDSTVQATIEKGIACLAGGRLATPEQIWVSRSVTKERYIANDGQETTYLMGLEKGIGGVLYFLAEAYQAGFNIDTCREKFRINWQFLDSNRFQPQTPIIPGLHYGSAGTSIAFLKGVAAGLINMPPEMLPIIEAGMLIDTEDLTISSGLAGHGLAILKAKNVVGGFRTENQLWPILQKIKSRQEKDGSWIIRNPGHKKALKLSSFNHGISGIVYFLLQYYEHFKDEVVLQQALKGLAFLKKHSYKAGKGSSWVMSPGGGAAGPWLEYGATGIVLPFIKAYTLTHDQEYKNISQDTLHNHSTHLVTHYLSVLTGATGIGEVYLEAWKAFGSEEWKERAGWIVQLLLHTNQVREDDSLYWTTDNTTLATADLLLGSTGILLYLMKWMNPEKTAFQIYN